MSDAAPSFDWSYEPGGSTGEGPKPGESFAGLRVVEVLGEGGMGRVYRAHDPQLDRDVALKVMLRPLDASQRARFAREIELTARLRHPGVVAVHRAEVSGNDKPYLVLELVERARSLQEAMGELTPGERVELIAEVADAVGFLHEHGVVHRDLKPSNILVDPLGRARICDLGLARHLAEHQRLTRTGALVGTPLYMAPEQFRGAKAGPDPRVDVWALGTLLYEAIAGAHPSIREGMTLHELMARLQRRPSPPIDATGSLPAGVPLVCVRALEPDPSRRFTDARAFCAALREAMAGSPDRGGRLALGALLLVLLAGVLAFLVASTPTPEPRAETPTREVASERGALPEPETPTPALDATGLYNRACALQREGRLQEALADLNAALVARPEFPLALSLRAGVHASLGSPEEAKADFSRVIAQDPKNAAAYSGRGALRLQQGDDGAIFDLNQAIELDPSNAAAHDNRGQARRLLGDLVGAYADLSQAIALDPNCATAYNARGLVHRDRGQHRKAIDDHSMAIALAPENPLGWLNRGGARLALGDTDGAWSDFEEALKLDPKHSMALANRGVIKGQRGDLAAAIADFDAAIEADPRNALGYQNRAYAKVRLGDRRGAISDYEAALQLTANPRQADRYRTEILRLQSELNRKP